jgi:hypothetical protein
VTSGAAMRVVVPRAAAWVARRRLLPLLRHRGTFPRGATAPADVRPSADFARSLSAADAADRIVRHAAAAARALRAVDGRRPPLRVTHANFGPLAPLAPLAPLEALEALHLLTLHTRHHARYLVASADDALRVDSTFSVPCARSSDR